MTIDSQTNALLKAFGADPATLRQFLDAHLKPEAQYHAQALRFIKAVDDLFDAQNSLADWVSGHIQMSKHEQEPHYTAEKAKVSAKREEFVHALKGLLEAFWGDSNGK